MVETKNAPLYIYVFIYYLYLFIYLFIFVWNGDFHRPLIFSVFLENEYK